LRLRSSLRASFLPTWCGWAGLIREAGSPSFSVVPQSQKLRPGPGTADVLALEPHHVLKVRLAPSAICIIRMLVCLSDIFVEAEGHASQRPIHGRGAVSQTMILRRHPATGRSQPQRTFADCGACPFGPDCGACPFGPFSRTAVRVPSAHRSLLCGAALPVAREPIEQGPGHGAIPFKDGRPFF
jgi:hypothetical protein